MCSIWHINETESVAFLSERTALLCGIEPAVAKQIRIAAALHDVGKQKIPAAILNKPGKLTKDEFEVIKEHTKLGAEMLEGVQGGLGAMARTVCLTHHEWWDGNGYWGYRTDDLPPYVPIVAISDVFTALICERPYKQAWPPREAMDYIQKQAGTQFSPDLVGVFLSMIQGDENVAAFFTGR